MPDLGLSLRRLMLRTDPVLHPVWRALHMLVVRLVSAWARRISPGATVYVVGSYGYGEPASGISDIDVVVIVPDGQSEPFTQRWRAIATRFPPVGRLVFVAAYDERTLRLATTATCLTHDAPVLLGERPVRDSAGLIVRPRLEGQARGWRRIAGPDLRPAPRRWSDDDLRIAGWLELQFWWYHAFEGAIRSPELELAWLCVRLVAEPARIWLAIVHGLQPRGRRDVLTTARRLQPAEEATLSAALSLLHNLPRQPEARLADVLPYLVRQSRRIGRALATASTTEVGLAGSIGPELPYVDFRALVTPTGPNEKLWPVPGDPTDPAALAAAARAEADGRQPAIVADDLLVLPSEQRDPTILRAVQCPTTDPVSFAVLAGARTATFADAPGRSPAEWARRAVAEHGAWLGATAKLPSAPRVGDQPSSRIASLSGLEWLFSAARAGLFHRSVAAGEPVLPLTMEAIVAGLETPVAEEALSAHAEGAVDQKLFEELGRVVRALPAYE